MKRDCACPQARHVHGTPAGRTVCGCRCFDCRVAYAAQVRARRAGHGATRGSSLVPRAGTRRRLEALHALGWTGPDLADRLGVTVQGIFQLRTNPRPLYPVTADAVAALYDDLWDKPRPTTVRHRQWVKRQGFLPPLAWDDDEIDDPAAEPHTPDGPSAWDLQPCGTHAAARRHYRRGEPLCPACVNASRRQKNERKAAA